MENSIGADEPAQGNNHTDLEGATLDLHIDETESEELAKRTTVGRLINVQETT